MIFDFKCKMCGKVFEETAGIKNNSAICPDCKGRAVKIFSATTNFHIPPYFRTSRSDIFSDSEWAALKKDPNIERA